MLDLTELEQSLNTALEKETVDSLTKWIIERNNQNYIDMKQTLEEAASEYMNILPVKAAIKCGDIEDLESHIKIAFKAGAKWQSDQIKEIIDDDTLTDGEVIDILYNL